MEFRKCYEITGYVVRECVICPSCYEDFKEKQQNGLEPHNEDINPIFLESEWDYQPTCEWCNSDIDISLIGSE